MCVLRLPPSRERRAIGRGGSERGQGDSEAAPSRAPEPTSAPTDARFRRGSRARVTFRNGDVADCLQHRPQARGQAVRMLA